MKEKMALNIFMWAKGFVPLYSTRSIPEYLLNMRLLVVSTKRPPLANTP